VTKACQLFLVPSRSSNPPLYPSKGCEPGSVLRLLLFRCFLLGHLSPLRSWGCVIENGGDIRKRKKVRSNRDTSCFAKRTLFLWQHVTNKDTFVVLSRKEEEPQIRHQIQIRVGFFHFTISKLHFIFNSHLFPSQFDLRIWTQQLDW
jgi:hypothetical protein